MRVAWLLRMAQWARHPPSAARVKMVAAIAGLCVLVAAAEWMGWLPDWLALDPKGLR